jgi:serine/threonine protein phosphatase PrpC
MPPLTARAAQLSATGPKAVNDDALGLHLPQGHGLSACTLAAAIADGVSSVEGGRIAAETSVTNFLNDFFATPASWSVKTAGFKVLEALNRWLHGQGQHYQHAHQAFLTTFTALVIRGACGHVFHIGDSRLWRLRGNDWECLTTDHELVTRHGNQLTRALGMAWRVEMDYREIDVQPGDLYLLTTDGIHGFVPSRELCDIVAMRSETLEARCEELLACAKTRHSDDNRSCQLVEIVSLPPADKHVADESALPLLPDTLQPGRIIDGYRIEAEVHANARSHLYRVTDLASGKIYALKSPSPNLSDDPEALRAFQREDWIGQRFQQPEIIRTHAPERPRTFLYLIQDYVEGQTLRQWRADNPDAPVETVMAFALPAVKALRALHRRETLHQDVKPDNFLVTKDGKLVLIDFGSATVGSLSENLTLRPGAAEYAAPEYALGVKRDHRADQFGLAVMFYELLTGQFPYGPGYVNAVSPGDFRKLAYTSACKHNAHVPVWLDAALSKALSLNAEHRYPELSEFLTDLQRPNTALTAAGKPWIERDPVLFWKVLAAVSVVGNLVMGGWLLR